MSFLQYLLKEIILLYINKMAKRLEDLTLEEIKAQLSIFQTMYQKKRKEIDPEYAEKLREKDRNRYYKKRDAEGRPPPVKNGNRKYNHQGMMLVQVEN